MGVHSFSFSIDLFCYWAFPISFFYLISNLNPQSWRSQICDSRALSSKLKISILKLDYCSSIPPLLWVIQISLALNICSDFNIDKISDVHSILLLCGYKWAHICNCRNNSLKRMMVTKTDSRKEKRYEWEQMILSAGD